MTLQIAHLHPIGLFTVHDYIFVYIFQDQKFAIRLTTKRQSQTTVFLSTPITQMIFSIKVCYSWVQLQTIFLFNILCFAVVSQSRQ